MDFKKTLKELQPPVWKEVQKYLPHKTPKDFYDIIADYPHRLGKYFRPGLVLLSTQMYGGKKQKAITTASAMQVSEDWLLVHDDFLDHSLERRSTKEEHKPSLNIKHGDEVSVNAGDGLHAIMWQILGDNVRKLGDKVGWQVYDKMVDVILTTLEGQHLELRWENYSQIEITEKQYYDMISRKTSYYTVTAPLQLGAMVAGVSSSKELEKIREWGFPFGKAFQVWDDVMNVTVASDKQGKEIGGDILEGKRTLLLIHLLKHCTPEEKKKIIAIYKKPREQKTEKEKNYVIRLMNQHGSIDHAKKVAKKFSAQAKTIFIKNTSHLPDSKYKKAIVAGIEFVVNRDR